MNHYEVDDVSRKKDMMAIEKIKSIDPEGLYEVVLEKNISMCGISPVLSLLFSAKEKGIKNAELVAYSNSGEVTQDFSSVVGYAGIVIY
jgi:AmmeMemoRadiSam system protein B